MCALDNLIPAQQWSMHRRLNRFSFPRSISNKPNETKIQYVKRNWWKYRNNRSFRRSSFHFISEILSYLYNTWLCLWWMASKAVWTLQTSNLLSLGSLIFKPVIMICTLKSCHGSTPSPWNERSNRTVDLLIEFYWPYKRNLLQRRSRLAINPSNSDFKFNMVKFFIKPYICMTFKILILKSLIYFFSACKNERFLTRTISFEMNMNAGEKRFKWKTWSFMKRVVKLEV